MEVTGVFVWYNIYAYSPAYFIATSAVEERA